MSYKKVLRIDSSSSTKSSASRQLCDLIIEHLSPGQLTLRDLTAPPLPIVNEDWITARMKSPADQTALEKSELAQSDTLVAELLAADIIVIGLPIYNFGIPAALKSWIDLIVRPGLTIQFTAEGAKPQVHGKRVILAVASATTIVGSDIDFCSTYMRLILSFIGLTEIDVVAADLLAFDRDGALAKARTQVAALAR